MMAISVFCFFFFNDTATTEIYTLSLHDALPISTSSGTKCRPGVKGSKTGRAPAFWVSHTMRSEEHTSELQSRSDLVCRLLLEKKKATTRQTDHPDRHAITAASSAQRAASGSSRP